ncbi:efflux RND transporter periplasmic adaptor subunit [Alteriqipengyuania sp. NZ-12B]|uniref:Efflux RND transporter periplasmic adaptor subunit n=1 Tax=Alteriqipengyuania abyssalis TaxID=2860200 RepID=A0ABS7PB76_9SPHN|nr:efflux RND transporter periplasmic adaptor subunit [Alteriqipengyuania abyssalis]MBY8336309.1 efflux RND transporter periplasmic adaptor subunit [Alteriqipengyuania abyssalis]
MTRRKLAILVGIVIAVGAMALIFWPTSEVDDHAREDDHGKEEAATETPEGVITLSEEQISEAGIQLASVRSGAAVELVFPATVAASPTASARIDARASGVVRSVGKTLGDYVARGETVARIESADAAALASQVSAARARVSELSAAYERERRLFEENVTARQDLEAARANLSVARSELQRAQAAVAAAGVSGDGRSLAVTSPLAGRITAAPIVLGAFVDAGEELYRVVDPNGLQIEVALPSAEASRIQPGDEAVLVVGDGREIGARVRSVTPSLDPESRSATAVLSLSRGVPGLQPGAFLQARIRPSGEIDRDRIAVPEDAIQVVEGRDVIFVRTKTGFQARDVELGTRSAGQVTILSGLQEGWQIAVANAFLLKAELGKEGATHGH